MKMYLHGGVVRDATKQEQMLFDMCQDAVVTEIEMCPNGNWDMALHVAEDILGLVYPDINTYESFFIPTLRMLEEKGLVKLVSRQ